MNTGTVDDGYRLVDVVAKANGINHALLSEAEFTRAVPRLVAAGLVGADAVPTATGTDAGHALYQRRMRRHGLFGWMDAIPPALRGLGTSGRCLVTAGWRVRTGNQEACPRSQQDPKSQQTPETPLGYPASNLPT